MSKDFSESQIKRELKTRHTIKAIYPELKLIVNTLALSPKNLEYYASLVRHKSSFRLRRHADEQSILYLVCYLFFRYRETNDNLVSAFSYLVRKLSESAKSYGKHKVADDLEVVRNNLKVAGNLLNFFIESDISDDMAFGDIRKKAFKLLSKEKIRLLSSHLDNNDFDTRQYEWEYVDKQASKIKKILRSIFLGIDLEFTHVKADLSKQYQTTRTELMDDSAIKSIDTQVVAKSERKYFDGISPIKKATRFEYFLYQKAEQLFHSNTLTVVESEKNRSLATDLIPHDEWVGGKPEVIDKTGLNKIVEPINDTLQATQEQLNKKMEAVSQHILVPMIKRVYPAP